VALSPRANYTNWATATCRWNWYTTAADKDNKRLNNPRKRFKNMWKYAKSLYFGSQYGHTDDTTWRTCLWRVEYDNHQSSGQHARYCPRKVALSIWTTWLGSMPSSALWRRVALVRTDVSEERIASIIRVERISELRTALAETSNWSTLGRKYFFLFSLQRVSIVSRC
jgi:hypothetical protein